ncbi:MAG: nitroreductase [Actinobacteria bacterium]|nr:MAG: nitroreductase [Actinomycetota bacterium]
MDLEACLRAAVAAPSIHNSQPWRFVLRPGGVDLYADRTRKLGVVDPRGRELFISLGAALLNLRLAILSHGRMPVTRLLPDPGEPDLVAAVRFGPPVDADPAVRALADAIPHRRTSRRPFDRVLVPAEVLAELSAAARLEGATLAVADDLGRDQLLGLARSAERMLRRHPGYLAELTEWTSADPGRADGVPQAAFGPWDALETLPLRDFGLTRRTEPRRGAHFEAHPTLVVLSTAGDTPQQWLRAGQALERVLLTATVQGLATTPLSQPLELPRLRLLMTDRDVSAYPQVVLRIGYGPAGVPSPRRPLDDVVDRTGLPAATE